MNLSDFEFSYPEELIATSPAVNSRVMWVPKADNNFSEISVDDLIEKFSHGDVLVVNTTQVLKRRVFSQEGYEVLFIRKLNEKKWEVLYPSSRVARGKAIILPEGIEMRLVEPGRPQIVELTKDIEDSYFEEHGELPLPPYIQKAREQRNQKPEDDKWYQPVWSKTPGSLASPTASLHFKEKHIEKLKNRGVEIANITLHVGLGTFLPIAVKKIEDHVMHEEYCTISNSNLELILQSKSSKKNIWALGTTVARTLESYAQGLLHKTTSGYDGNTKLFIRPGFRFQIVDRLLTNFHQPHTTLLALVAAFAGQEKWQKAYAWAIEKKFRLFSYGDLTCWEQNSD